MKLSLMKATGKQARYILLELFTLLPNQFLSNAKINSYIRLNMLLKSTSILNEYFNKLDSIVKKLADSKPEVLKNFRITLDTTLRSRVVVYCPLLASEC